MEHHRNERTFVAVKPDGVQRGLIGDIVKRFEVRGYKIIAGKLVWPPEELILCHYKDVSDRPYFGRLVHHMKAGPIFAMVWEGRNAVKMGRKMLGVTDPCECDPGTIRGDYCCNIIHTACHASDSVEAAEREIDLWFTKEELFNYSFSTTPWIYERIV